jgi:predicted nucleic acid-binding Zn ribbon protein
VSNSSTFFSLPSGRRFSINARKPFPGRVNTHQTTGTTIGASAVAIAVESCIVPIYPFRCPTCEATRDEFKHVDERDANPPACCGAPMARQLTAPMVSVPANCAYKCPVTGQVVTSYRQRANIMAEHRLTDANDFSPQYMVERKRKERAENERLAAQLYADTPKEIVTQATAIAHDAAA